jgi:hypothetical protein
MVQQVSTQDFAVPLYYVIKRGLGPEEIEKAKALLSLTPCQAAFVTEAVDAEMAWQIVPEVLYASSPEAIVWAKQTGRPILTVGKTDFLDAVYEDGRHESLNV